MKIETNIIIKFNPITVTIETETELMLLLRMYGSMGNAVKNAFDDSINAYDELCKIAKANKIDYIDGDRYPYLKLEIAR